MRFYAILLFVNFGISCLAQIHQSPQFYPISQNDHTDQLRIKNLKTSYGNIKYQSIGEKGFFSFGGSYRFQSESFINEQFIEEENQDIVWFFNRIMAYGLLKLNDKFQVFLELNSSTVINKENISMVDKDILSINQLFAKYYFSENWGLLIGRENLNFGSGRLIDFRDGPNVRRSFDLIRVIFESDSFQGTFFGGFPVKIKSGVFDNKILEYDEFMAGIYTTALNQENQKLDVYTLFQKDDAAVYNSFSARENRFSLGFRHFGQSGSLLFNNEFVFQFGNFGNQSVSAWTASVQLDYPLKWNKSDLIIGLKTEVISGDKSQLDNTQNTFDALYPRGAYFGRVARFGPANLIDFHPNFTLTFKGFLVELDYDVFWRYSNEDAVYNAALIPEYISQSRFSFIAHQVGALVSYEVNPFIAVELESNIIIPGAFLRDIGRDNTLFHLVLTTEFKL